jgi:hypothetical protein
MLYSGFLAVSTIDARCALTGQTVQQKDQQQQCNASDAERIRDYLSISSEVPLLFD